ncbi:hypothetical protein HGRIS_004961 [Hohenbuehelia grisea]|uniref:DNA polymerase delta subunit 3 n=1 Tax=Hohenbuehelia grisea TaxID=104357 RepID=A0ABR3JED3_9AGAR
MTSQDIEDFLTKQLSIEKNIVTYRSLSRAFFIHVNAAKNALAAYHKAAKDNIVCATYMVTGELRRYPEDTGDAMDVDGDAPGPSQMSQRTIYEEDGEEEMDDSEEVPEFTMMLVAQHDLETTKSEFSNILSITVYALSPATILDADILCSPTEAVRKVDGSKKGQEKATAMGKIVGKNIKPDPARVKARAARALTSSKAPPKSATAPGKGQAAESSKGKEKEEPSKDSDKPKLSTDRPKATGKLNFSKAKTKETKTKEKEAVKPTEKLVKKEEPKRNFFFDGKAKARAAPEPEAVKSLPEREPTPPKEDAKPAEQPGPKRGTKRKSTAGNLLDSDSDNESSSSTRANVPVKQPPSAPSGLRVKKGVILSDEDESEAEIKPVRTNGRRRKAPSAVASDADSEAERELKAMMEVDDDKVTRVLRETASVPETPDASEPGGDEDVNMDEENSDVEEKPIVKPKAKRKAKKVIPVGSNGLKKRRITKSRSTVDDKGYMITEDYSSYESVGEDEEQPESKPSKAKAKPKTSKPDEPTAKSSKPDEPTAAAAKSSKPQEKSSASAGGKSDSKDGSSVKSKPKPKTAKSQKNIMNFFGGGAKSKS